MRLKDRNIAKSSRWTNGRLSVPVRVFLAAAVACTSLAFTGCKPSDVLTELFYDQNVDEVDEDSTTKFLNNILDTLNLTEDLAQLKEEKTDLEREVKDEDPVRGDKTNTDATVAQTVPDEAATSKSQTHKKTKGEKESSKTKKNGSKSKTKGNGDGGNGGDGTVYRGDGGTGTTYGENGNYEELPTGVQTVVAFGECANMVVSFAGEHALMGADKTFLSNSFIKKAYKSKDIANAKVISANKSGEIDVDKVVELKPDALLLSGTNYKITDSDKAALEEAKVDVVYVPDMNSASNIVEAAEEIGEMFGSGTLSGDDAGKAAENYIEWHNDVLKSTNNGKLAGDFDFDKGETADGTKGKYTLYVDKWDDCTYYATPEGSRVWTDSNGVAISKVGYKWSPMSYYLSAGGTYNVSGLFKKVLVKTTAYYYVWQFNLGAVPTVYDKYWSGRSISVSDLSNSGTEDLLVKASDGTCLGSSNYSYVIARTKAIATKMKASNAKKKTGIYGVYSSVAGTDGKSGRGFLSKKGLYCSAAIQGTFDVLVNPQGLYSSWINGSPESVLEAVWIDDVNNGSSNLSSKLKEYYKMFYNVDLSNSQVKTITNGPSK